MTGEQAYKVWCNLKAALDKGKITEEEFDEEMLVLNIERENG